jgi:hypothetical protein
VNEDVKHGLDNKLSNNNQNLTVMNKCFYLIITASLLFFAACKKENTPLKSDDPPPTGDTLATGTFISNAHPTRGTVRIVKDSIGKISLSFENFQTDNGPDLRVWLATNTTATNYRQAGALTAVTGNFSYPLDSLIDYNTYNNVLIWCEDFSVLFGHAVLR